MEPKIISEDESILVLNKSAGMVVNRAKTTKEATVQDWLEDYLRIKGRGIGERAGIVHRLDKETSGILLVAKTQKAFEDLQNQFKQRKVEKRYLALVHGKVEPKEGRIEAPISRNPFDRKKFGVFLDGRSAKTKYEILRYYDMPASRDSFGMEILGKFSLLKLMPETGRTHQIRVHFKYINHPVVGDKKYAGRKTARKDRQWCPRQFLHASYLSFTHPKTGKKVEFSSKLPRKLEEVLKTLKPEL